MKSGNECHLQYLITFALLAVPASLLIQLTVLLQHSPTIDVSVRFLISDKDASPDALHCASQLSSKPLKKTHSFYASHPLLFSTLVFYARYEAKSWRHWSHLKCCHFASVRWRLHSLSKDLSIMNGGEVGNEVTQEKESLSSLHPLNTSSELSLLWYVSSCATVFVSLAVLCLI